MPPSDPEPVDGAVEEGGGDGPDQGPGALAGIPVRAVARVSDVVVSLLLPSMALLVAFGTEVEQEDGSTLVEYPGWVVLASFGILLAYEVGFVAWRGQTPGMMVSGLRVVRAEDEAAPTLAVAARRAALPVGALVLSAFLPILQLGYVVVYGSAILDPVRRQGWHDRLAGTLVVRTR